MDVGVLISLRFELIFILTYSIISFHLLFNLIQAMKFVPLPWNYWLGPFLPLLWKMIHLNVFLQGIHDLRWLRKKKLPHFIVKSISLAPTMWLLCFRKKWNTSCQCFQQHNIIPVCKMSIALLYSKITCAVEMQIHFVISREQKSAGCSLFSGWMEIIRKVSLHNFNEFRHEDNSVFIHVQICLMFHNSGMIFWQTYVHV